MRIVVLSDTHIPDFAKTLPSGLLPVLRKADLILHAGDVTSREVLEELSTFAPVKVAMGNNDGPDVAAWGARPEVTVDVDGTRIAMLHDPGRREGRERRLRRRFPDAHLIVFGHSHIPIDTEVDGVLFLNPGSPTWKRRQPTHTFGVAEVTDQRVRTRIVELPP
ncbi:MAG TPA: YfcE family phosphodiesterase [Actinomycetota bacterium]|nr:YfcE family phosphodiesterase [Actinomycetota bacterium]